MGGGCLLRLTTPVGDRERCLRPLPILRRVAFPCTGGIAANLQGIAGAHNTNWRIGRTMPSHTAILRRVAFPCTGGIAANLSNPVAAGGRVGDAQRLFGKASLGYNFRLHSELIYAILPLDTCRSTGAHNTLTKFQGVKRTMPSLHLGVPNSVHPQPFVFQSTPLLAHHVAALGGISRRTVRWAAQRGLLRGFKSPSTPKIWRFHRHDVEAYLRRKEQIYGQTH